MMMQDRGDNIIHLAHEILNAGIDATPLSAPAPRHESTARFKFSFKTLCLTTCIAAFGSFGIASWNAEQNRPLTKYERTELDALIFYNIKLHGGDEESLRHDVTNRLGLDSFDDMTMRDFRRARNMLRTRAQNQEASL